MLMHCLVRLGLAACCIVAGLNLAPAEARRVALVIGNAEHRFLPVLKNPANDATAVAAALERLNFDKVSLKKDLGFDAFRAALRELSREAEGAEAAVLFFAGNGIEFDGRNYLIPVDARLERASDIDLEAIRLETVLEQVADAKLGLVIIDACRNNPFAGRITRDTRGVPRGVGRGPGKFEPHRGLFVAYAALPGTVATDGIGRHSPFTEALLRHLPTPGLELRQLFRLVRSEVLAATRGHQLPETWDTFDGEFVFKAAQ
jgi:uncharacterized caspase-like protein